MDARIQEIQQQICEFKAQKQAEVDELQATIVELRKQLESKKQPELPSEVYALRAQLEEFNSRVAKNSQTVVELAKERQCRLNDARAKEAYSRQKKNKAQYTGRYLTSLKAEKRRLEEEFLTYQKQFIELQEQIAYATAEEQALRRYLVYRELSESSSSDVFDHEKMAENLQQVEQYYNTESRLNSRSTMRTRTTAFSYRTQRSTASTLKTAKPANRHAMCYARLYVLKNRVAVLKQSIEGLKREFQPVIRQAVQSLRECGFLESFLDNGELALSEAQKEELAANLAQDPAFVPTLVRVCAGGGIRGVLKDDAPAV